MEGGESEPPLGNAPARTEKKKEKRKKKNKIKVIFNIRCHL